VKYFRSRLYNNKKSTTIYYFKSHIYSFLLFIHPKAKTPHGSQPAGYRFVTFDYDLKVSFVIVKANVYAACLSALRSLASQAATRSSTSHSRSVTPAAIAGVTRSVR